MKYQWDKWFGMKHFELVRGVDYFCSQSTMSQTIRNNASHRGVGVRMKDTGSRIIVDVVNRVAEDGTDEVQHTDTAAVAQ